jgi:hypothetical protein
MSPKNAKVPFVVPKNLAEAVRLAGQPIGVGGKTPDKKNFAERLSRNFAQVFADRLRGEFAGVLPDKFGARHESKALGAEGPKKLDVNFSTPELGLGLGISIKTVNARDRKSKRYTKNLTRVDAELRAEATDYHRRQPYAVLVAIVFFPQDACSDATTHAPSSFGAAVRAFRRRNDRQSPEEFEDTFELLFVALYENNGACIFLDVNEDPPRNGPPVPGSELTFEQVIERIRAAFRKRNVRDFQFAPEEPKS